MLLLLLTFLLPLLANADCPNGSIQSYRDNTTCYFLFNNKTDFIDAEGICMGIGGHLTSVHDMFENMFLAEKASSNFTDSTSGDFWIGANDLVTTGNWTWTDNTPFDFTDWDKGQPQNVSDCCSITIHNGKWITDDCFKQKSFVCVVHASTSTTSSIFVTTTTPKPKSCPNSWAFYNTTQACYKVLDTSTWLLAEDMCKVEGSHLTSIHSFEEAAFIAKLAYYDGADCDLGHHAWIGLFTDDNGATWKWTDGTSFDYPNWAVRQPDNPGVENCGEIMLSSCPSHFEQTQYNNWPCGNVLTKFVCKKMPQ